MKFDYDAEYFNPLHTLDCGQVFRFRPYKEGFFLISGDKACYIHSDGVKTVVESDCPDYFYEYFDLNRDYLKIVERAKSYNIPLLSKSAESCKGLRMLLKQDRAEMIFSFIISQNNNIPRIKGILERICVGLGEKLSSPFGEYYSFPSAEVLKNADMEFFKRVGAGYRDEYIKAAAEKICLEGVERLETLPAEELKYELLKFKGIGPKVADCIALFGFGKTEVFPVDTWIEKIYAEDFHGNLKDRKKIAKYFTDEFGEYSGFIQQYLFYGKRLNL